MLSFRRRHRRRLFYFSLLCMMLMIIKMRKIPKYLTKMIQMELNKKCFPNRNAYKHHCVIIVRSCRGRLGNQMFLFASAYGLARQRQCYLYIGETLFNELAAVFKLKLNNTITKAEVDCLKGVTTVYTVCRFLPELFQSNTLQYIELDGYWQTYRHFMQCSNELRRQFVFNDYIIKTAVEFFKNLTQINKIYVGNNSSWLHLRSQIVKNSTRKDILKTAFASSKPVWIGIHVRRKDFIRLKMDSSSLYIYAAMEYFRNKYTTPPTFIITSDDKYYCNRLFGERSDVIITPISFAPSEDLAVLSLCHHMIVTAGTFGWWAAFLIDGEVLHDSNYPRGNPMTDTQCSKQMYYLPHFLIPVRKTTNNKQEEYVFERAKSLFNITDVSHLANTINDTT